MKRFFLIFVLIITLSLVSSALFFQEQQERTETKRRTFAEIQAEAREFYNLDAEKKRSGWKQYKRWEWYAQSRLDRAGYFSPSLSWKWWEIKQQRFGSSADTPDIATWESYGPAVISTLSPYSTVGGLGRLNCIEFHPLDLNTLWVGAPAGGLWKSIDGGETWITLTDDLPNIGVSDILIHPEDTDIMYIALGDGDGGQLLSGGIMKSLDGGETWQQTGFYAELNDNLRIKKMLMHPLDPEVILTATNFGIFKTINGGKDWTETYNGRYTDLEVNPANPSIWFACGWERGILRSTDSGETWSLVTNGLPTGGFTRMAIAFCESNPNFIYASYARTGSSLENGFNLLGVYRSTDGGTTWSLQADSPNLMGNTGPGDPTDYNLGHWAHVLAVSPIDPDTVFCGSVLLWRSTDGGRTWQVVAHQTGRYGADRVHVDHHELRFFPGNTQTLFLCNDGGLYKSMDIGNTWDDLSEGLVIRQIYRMGLSAQNPDHVIIGSHDNGSTLFDGRWRSAVGGDGMECLIDPHNPNIMYCSWQEGHLYRSEDGGNSWQAISGSIMENSAWMAPLVMDPVNSSTLYSATKQVKKTTQRGNNWQNLSESLTGSALTTIAVAPSNPLRIIVSNDTEMFRTNDGGSTWEELHLWNEDDHITGIAFHPYNPEIVWLTLGGYGEIYGWRKWIYPEAKHVILRSQDGGNSWINISGDLPQIPANCLVVDPVTSGVYIGTDLGVFYSPDGWENWLAFDQGLPNTIVSDIEIHPKTGIVWVSTFGRGVWRSKPAVPQQELAVYPPLFFSGEWKEDYSLFQTRYIMYLQWGANPRNQDKNITGYRLYRISGKQNTLVQEFGRDIQKYDYMTNDKETIRFELKAVNQAGTESQPLSLLLR